MSVGFITFCKQPTELKRLSEKPHGMKVGIEAKTHPLQFAAEEAKIHRSLAQPCPAGCSTHFKGRVAR